MLVSLGLAYLGLVVLSLVSIGLASLNFQHNTLNRTNVRKMIYNNLCRAGCSVEGYVNVVLR